MGLCRIWQSSAVVMAILASCWAPRCLATTFDGYSLAGSFTLPGGGTGPFDVHPDGRIVSLDGDSVYVETAAGSRAFTLVGALPVADFNAFGASFIRVSPDGTKIAVGNGGGMLFVDYEVGVFSFSTLAGDWFAVGHFDGEWFNDSLLALTTGVFGSPSEVTVLDTTSSVVSPDNRVVLGNIGGASAGVTFDSAGDLFTGNGFAGTGPSDTGDIRAFSFSAWMNAYNTSTPLDFELDGVAIVDLLTASSLGFDLKENLYVGGGDLFGGSGDFDYAGLVKGSIVAAVLAGGGEADPNDPNEVRRLDPDFVATDSAYYVTYNAVLRELYLLDDGVVHVYRDPEAVPTLSQWATAAMGLLLLSGGSIVFRRRSSSVRRSFAVNFIVLGVLLAAVSDIAIAESAFATAVIEYTPAPGQHVNDPLFNDPARALGVPRGGGVSDADNSSVVSLGGFGGSIVLGFDHTVTDDAANPLGLDAIVFGNAFWVGANPNRRWAECAIVEICRDVNGNGYPDENEPWYLIPGSHVTDLELQFENQIWDDDFADAVYPPVNPSWMPIGETGVWHTFGYRLPSPLFDAFVMENPLGSNAVIEGVWGYADLSPTLVLGDLDGDNFVDDEALAAEDFYTVPDDPVSVGVTLGSGGGDAFDIAWAISVDDGIPANLDGFDFIRVTTGINRLEGALGEASSEVDAVADVAVGTMGDADADRDIDLLDFSVFAGCVVEPNQQSLLVECRVMDFDGDGDVDRRDFATFQTRYTGDLSGGSPG